MAPRSFHAIFCLCCRLTFSCLAIASAQVEKFDGVAGTRAVLRYATKNKHNHTAEDIQAAADSINSELGRFDPERRHLFQIEVPNHMFTAYLYQSMGIELSLTPKEIDRIFWDAASPAVPTDSIEDFLEFLYEQKIRTGVISNITYSGEIVAGRINRLVPQNHFEFVLSTSEYMFRKPNRRIFDLALERAGLLPEDVWYVGDNYLCDVVGARNAGLFPVWYTGASHSIHDDNKDQTLVISHWVELMNMLMP